MKIFNIFCIDIPNTDENPHLIQPRYRISAKPLPRWLRGAPKRGPNRNRAIGMGVRFNEYNVYSSEDAECEFDETKNTRVRDITTYYRLPTNFGMLDSSLTRASNSPLSLRQKVDPEGCGCMGRGVGGSPMGVQFWLVTLRVEFLRILLKNLAQNCTLVP